MAADEVEVKSRRSLHNRLMRGVPSRILPPKKAARYLQLESKIRAVQAYDIAANIPHESDSRLRDRSSAAVCGDLRGRSSAEPKTKGRNAPMDSGAEALPQPAARPGEADDRTKIAAPSSRAWASAGADADHGPGDELRLADSDHLDAEAVRPRPLPPASGHCLGRGQRMRAVGRHGLWLRRH